MHYKNAEIVVLKAEIHCENLGGEEEFTAPQGEIGNLPIGGKSSFAIV